MMSFKNIAFLVYLLLQRSQAHQYFRRNAIRGFVDAFLFFFFSDSHESLKVCFINNKMGTHFLALTSDVCRHVYALFRDGDKTTDLFLEISLTLVRFSRLIGLAIRPSAGVVSPAPDADRRARGAWEAARRGAEGRTVCVCV